MRGTRALLAALAVLAACAGEHGGAGDAGAAKRYQGDGQFVDHGPLAGIRRYVIDLGEIDLATAGTRELSMAGLPPVEFTIGLQIIARAMPAEPLYDTQPLAATVRLELVDERGEVWISEQGPLDAWTWSGSGGDFAQSFVYIRDPLPGRAASAAAGAAARADGGWDSSFTPRPDGRYRATLSVVEPDPRATGYAITARAFGGGWKAEQAHQPARSGG